MEEMIFKGLDKLEGLERSYGIMGSIAAMIILLTVTAITVLGIYGLLKFWIYAIEILVPMIFEGWTL